MNKLIILIVLLCVLVLLVAYKPSKSGESTYMITYQFQVNDKTVIGEWYFDVNVLNKTTLAEMKRVLVERSGVPITGGTNGIVILNLIQIER